MVASAPEATCASTSPSSTSPVISGVSPGTTRMASPPAPSGPSRPERRGRGEQRVARAPLGVLQRHLDVRGTGSAAPTRGRAPARRWCAADCDVAGGRQHVAQDGCAAHLVQHFRRCRLHAGPETRRQDDYARKRETQRCGVLTALRSTAQRKGADRLLLVSSHRQGSPAQTARAAPNTTRGSRREEAGAPGFEPGNDGTKTRCLATWLRPTAPAQDPSLRGGEVYEAAMAGRQGRSTPWRPCTDSGEV